MDERPSYGRVVPVHNLCDYFRTSIDEVIEQQGVQLDPHATHYVVNMMALFSRSEELYEDDGETFGLRPLALMLADAADAPDPGQRQQILQRIGDVALFMAGFFIESFSNKAVDVDYYICMGENAYGSLSEEIRGAAHRHVLRDVFHELATKFQVLIDVLNEVRDSARPESDAGLLRTYEVWRKTGSRRAESILRRQGVVPLPVRKAPGH